MALTGAMTAAGVARVTPVLSSSSARVVDPNTGKISGTRKTYKVTEWRSGNWSCTCMNWTRRCTKATDHSTMTGTHCKHIRQVMGQQIPPRKDLRGILEERVGKEIWNRGVPDSEMDVVDGRQRDKPWYTSPNWDNDQKKWDQEQKGLEALRRQSRGVDSRSQAQREIDRMYEKEQKLRAIEAEREEFREERDRRKALKNPLAKKVPVVPDPPTINRSRPIARLDEEV